MLWKTGAVVLLSMDTSICCMASAIQHNNSSHFPFSLFNSAGVFLAHKAELAVGSVSAKQWDTIHFPWQGGPYGGQRRFLQTKTLQQGYTLQTHQAIPSLSLWMNTLSSFSITLRIDKKPFREILSQCCLFNLTDAKAMFILFLLN